MKVIISAFILYLIHTPLIMSCTLKVGDKEMKLSGQWEWRTHGEDNDIFSLSFCKASKSCKDGAYICKENSTNIISYGTPNTTTSSNGKDFELLLSGGNQCASDKTKKMSAKVIISCGRTLGELTYIEEADCVAYFEFSTNEVCHNMGEKKQIPCYIFNDDKLKIDLSPLQRVAGHQRARSFLPDTEAIFNVCADVTDEPECSSSSFCVKSKNTYNKTASIDINSTKLTIQNNEVILRYSPKQDSCSAILRLHCPSKSMDSSPPILTQVGGSCDYEIFWITEHACPITDQIVKNTCIITASSGDKFNLNVLKKQNSVTMFTYNGGSNNYTIRMNVCGPLPSTISCNQDSSASVCQSFKTKDGKNSMKVLGSSTKTTLRYTDKKLIYTMKNGEKCSSNFNRVTVITFKCDINALDSKPIFDYEDACTYFFNWRTNHACPYNRAMGSECRVTSKGNTVYDLTPLVSTNKTWYVDNSLKWSVRISVCGLLKDQLCGESSLCAKGDKQSSLGKYKTNLKLLDNNDLYLQYVDGSMCDGKPINTSIYFHCAAGDETSLPILKKTGCDYRIEWNTAYACPLVEHKGHRCSIYNNELQMDINLDYLKPPNGKWFSVPTKEYEYQLRICDGSRNTSCNVGPNVNKSIGICQHALATSGQNKVVGLVEDEDLQYYGGVFSMDLSGGEKCHKNHKNRSAEIIFVCNMTAGIGSPVFEKEKTHCYYRFIWQTKYACLPKVGICESEVGGKTYDLSALSRKHNEDNWEIKTSSGTFYINVCRPHNTMSSKQCSPFAGICYKPENEDTIEYGSVAASEPLHIENGEIIMQYKFDNGSCSAEITFVCEHGSLGTPQRDVSPKKDCHQYFIWRTNAACPVKEENGLKGNCSIRDRLTGVDIDLNILSHPYEYNITVGSKKYHINVCKQSTSCGKDVASCWMDKDKKLTSIGKVSREVVMENEVLMLTYKSGDIEITKTVIKFFCNIDKKENEIKFQSYDKITRSYFFTMETIQACSERELQCKQADPSGKFYNLEPLRKFYGYWTGLSRDTFVNSFYLNLCKPMHYIPNKKCASRSRGCLETSNNSSIITHSYNSRHFQTFENTVVLNYFGPTAGGVNLFLYLHCSINQGSPYYQTHQTNAVIFNWFTPAACPVVRKIGSSCKVADNRNEHLYDLSALKMDNTGSFMIDSDKILHISVCSKNDICQGNSGACLTNKAGVLIESIGDYNEKLHFENDGELLLNYTSDKNFITVIFICDYDNAVKNILKSGNKGYIVEWPTRHACKQKDIECSVMDTNKNIYDLSPLSKREFNWQASINGDARLKNKKIFINVCRPLKQENIVGKCLKTTGICVVQNDGQSLNIGSMETSPSVGSDGHIILKYTKGDICNGNTRYSAKIHILPGDNSLGTPLLDHIVDCEYHFEWKSSVAWHILHRKRGTQLESTCKVENKLTGYVYDFNPLKGTNHEVLHHESGETFNLDICGTTNNEPQSKICNIKSGSGISIECLSNKNEISSDNILYMKFGSSRKLYLINFVCDMNEGKPVIVTKTETLVVFVWRTAHACEHLIQCDAFSSDGKVMNLNQLKFPQYYEVKIGADVSGDAAKNKYRINICQNIVSKDCPHQAAVCNVNTKKALGQLSEFPVLENSGDVVITYKNGDQCDVDASKQFESRVKIKCDKNAMEAPSVTLQSVSGCVYQFTMTTSLVCKEEVVETKDCIVQYGNNKYDFGLLQKQESEYTVKSKEKPNSSFRLNICHVSTVTDDKCKGAQVCMVTKVDTKITYKSFGLLKDFKWKKEAFVSGIFIYEYKTDNMLTAIQFFCDPKKSIGYPILGEERISDTSSYVKFEWGTSLLCKLPNYSNKFKNVTQFFDKEIEIESPLGRLYISLSGFRSDFNKPVGCPQTAAVCLVDKNDKVYAIGLHVRPITTDGDTSISLEYWDGKYIGESDSKVIVQITCKKVKEDITFDKYDDKKNTFYFKAAAPYNDCITLQSTVHPKVTSNRYSTNKKDSSSSSSDLKKRGTAIAVLAVCIVVAIFLICFGILMSSKERRYTFESTVRGLFCCKKADVPSYRYHKLTANISDDDEDDEMETIVETRTNEPNSSRRRRVSVDSFKDDDTSDEELLRI